MIPLYNILYSVANCTSFYFISKTCDINLVFIIPYFTNEMSQFCNCYNWYILKRDKSLKIRIPVVLVPTLLLNIRLFLNIDIFNWFKDNIVFSVSAYFEIFYTFYRSFRSRNQQNFNWRDRPTMEYAVFFRIHLRHIKLFKDL